MRAAVWDASALLAVPAQGYLAQRGELAAREAELAELDNLYQSKLAEREVFLGGKIAEAELAGDFEALEQLQRELISDKKTLAAELEEKKEAVRNG